MGFLHPALLVALGALPVPVLLHLVGRRRAQVVPFAAIAFLQAAHARLLMWERLRQWLLIALRTLLVALLVLAAARPTPPKIQAVAATDGQRHLALVVDTSRSMAYVLEGTSLLQRAVTEGEALIKALGPNDTVSLVTTGPDIQVHIGRPTTDHRAALRVLAQLKVAAGEADLGAAGQAVLLATRELQFKVRGTTTVTWLSDLARSSFRGPVPKLVTEHEEARLLDVARRPALVGAAASLPNVAVVGASVEPADEHPSARQIKVMLHNYGPTPLTQVPILLQVDGVVMQRGSVDLPAGGAAEKAMLHRFAAPGTYTVTVAHEAGQIARADGLADDDSLTLQVAIERPVRLVCMVPNTHRGRHALADFVERALAEVPRGSAPFEVRHAAPWELLRGDAALLDTDVVLLAGTSTLGSGGVTTLERFVGRGGGLIFVLSDDIRFEAFNGTFAPLLPQPLRDQAVMDGSQRVLGIGELMLQHPLFAQHDGALVESLKATGVHRYFNLDTGAARRSRALMRFDNGAPALVEGTGDAGGRVMVWTTGLDLMSTDLPLRSAFVPLWQRLVRYAGQAGFGHARPVLRVGERWAVPLTPPFTQVAWEGPGVTPLTAEPVVDQAGMVESAPFPLAGRWQARGFDSERWRPLPELDVVVNVSLAESDFTPVDLAALEARLHGTSPQEAVGSGLSLLQAVAPSDDGTTHYGSPLLLAMMALVVGEALLGRRG